MNNQPEEITEEEDNVLPFRRLGQSQDPPKEDWLTPLPIGTVFVCLNYLSKGLADEYVVVRQDHNLTRLVDNEDNFIYVVPSVFCKYNSLIKTGVQSD